MSGAGGVGVETRKLVRGVVVQWICKGDGNVRLMAKKVTGCCLGIAFGPGISWVKENMTERVINITIFIHQNYFVKNHTSIMICYT